MIDLGKFRRSLQKRREFVRRIRAVDSVVLAPPGYSGGVKSLYTVCGWLGSLGKSTIQPFDGSHLVHWFAHRCEINQNNYKPDLVVYPAIHPINMGEEVFHLCCAFGKYKRIESHADLVVCKSPDTLVWLKEQNPKLRCVIVKPSIQRSLFEYDGRPKKEQICYMTRSHKFPETASQLRERYGNKVVEIVNQPEAVVAEMLKDAKVFVWRGNDKEGSPRPPKEALVAGCVVVGLNDDLNSRFYTDFGLKCSTVEELVGKAGEALRMPMPGVRERAVVRDSAEEKKDWVRLIRSLKVKRSVQRRAQG